LATTWKPKDLDVFVHEYIRSSSPKMSNLIKQFFFISNPLSPKNNNLPVLNFNLSTSFCGTSTEIVLMMKVPMVDPKQKNEVLTINSKDDIMNQAKQPLFEELDHPAMDLTQPQH
jgi:hypothetical protein